MVYESEDQPEPLRRLDSYKCFLRVRNLTIPALTHALSGQNASELVEKDVLELSSMGLVQPSRDVESAYRAVHPALALGLYIMDVLNGEQPPGSLSSLGGFTAVSRAVGVWRVTHPTLYVPGSVDSLCMLIEEAVSNAVSNVVSFHTAPISGSETFLSNTSRYLAYRGIDYCAVFPRHFYDDPR